MGSKIDWSRAHRRPYDPIAVTGPQAAPVRSRTRGVVEEDELARLVDDFKRRKDEREGAKALKHVRRSARVTERSDRFMDAYQATADARAHLLRVADEQERRRQAARAIAALHNGQGGAP